MMTSPNSTTLCLSFMLTALAGCDIGEVAAELGSDLLDAATQSTPVAPGTVYRFDGTERYPVAVGGPLRIQVSWGALCTIKSSVFCFGQRFRVEAACGDIRCTSTFYSSSVEDGVVDGHADLDLRPLEEGILKPHLILIHADSGERAVFDLAPVTVKRAAGLRLMCDDDRGSSSHECSPSTSTILELNEVHFRWGVRVVDADGRPLRADPEVRVNGTPLGTRPASMLTDPPGVCDQSEDYPDAAPVTRCGYATHGPSASDRWTVEARLGELTASTTFVPTLPMQ